MHLKPIKERKIKDGIGTRRLSFGAYEKREMVFKGDLSWCQEQTNHSKFLKRSMITSTKWNYEGIIVLILHLMYLIFVCLFDLRDDSRANSFEERGNGVILALTPRDPLEVSLDLVTRLKAKGLRMQLMNLL